MTRKTQCINNSLLWDDSIGSSFWHMVEYISLCAYKGIVFNQDKFHFAEREVEFVGFLVTDKKDDRSYSPFPNTYQYHQRQVLVWTRESNVMNFHMRRSWLPSENYWKQKKKQKVLLWWDTWRPIARVEESDEGKIEKGIRTFKTN